LRQRFNIIYHAPLNISHTEFPDNYADMIVSRNTMEHIPEAHIPGIIEENYRILKPGGVAIFLIDYRDHWSFFDKKISNYHFLKYDAAKWKRYNPSIHYQNRLRHIDFEKMIRKSPLKILKSIPFLPKSAESDKFLKLKVNEQFKNNYSLAELAVYKGHFILKG